MTYDEALEYIHGVSWTFCKPGLDRIGELCQRLGHPERGMRFIHVAGTNGKGSTSAMLDSILRRVGLNVGLFTSPYIYEFGERMRVGGENIGREELAEITEYVRPIAEAMTDRPTEFELITAIAFEFFKRRGCDVVVLEAGMGGRLDSTNIIREPLLSIITGIALDHTAFLGDTVEKIAVEKAGIIKDGAPLLYGGDCESAAEVIRAVANERGSRFVRSDHGAIRISSATLSGTKFDYKGWRGVRIPLLGSYQPKNAALVLEAVELLRGRGLKIPDSAVYEGLASAAWRGRFEIINKEPQIIFDGAHNPEGVAAAVESIKSYFGDERLMVLSGVLRDKDYRYIASRISEIADRAFTLTPDNPRALSAEEYAKEFMKNGIAATAVGDIRAAFLAAKRAAADEGKTLVCLGSLYTYVDIMKIIEGEK